MAVASLIRITKFTAFELLGAYECRLALVAHRERQSPKKLPIKSKIAYYALKCISIFLPLAKMMRHQESSEIERPQVYNQNLLNVMVNRVYDLPEIIVDHTAPKRINVLVPAFTIKTISAGFFGVFNVALFLADQGYKVRLVLFDNFDYAEADFKKALKNFPSMENLFEKLEVAYIGCRSKPLKVSPNDNSVATVWYSAYFADKIARLTGMKPFLYLIQDFEAAFYPFNSLYCISRSSYDFNYHSLTSSSSLLQYLKIQGILPKTTKSISFDNACSFSIYEDEEFLEKKSSSKKRFVFYSRPAVNRNMFEMAALALINAYKNGAFEGEDWEFYGMGIGNTIIQLEDSIEVKQLGRMPLKEYEAITKTFDLCLTLMSSPHPSLIPMDLAASGAIVVTNTFETKTEDYLRGLSPNIIPSSPELHALSDAIKAGVLRSQDVTARLDGAKVNWPKSWAETWGDEHRQFIKEVFAPC